MDFASASRLLASPHATAQELTDICNAYPQLRASVALHPNAHPELLNWLARLGDPEINAALAARAARQQPMPQRRGGGNGWVWAIVLVLLALVGFLVWRAMTTNEPDPSPTPTAEATQEATVEPSEEETDPATESETEPAPLGTIDALFPDAALAACVADALGMAVTDSVTQEDLAVIGADAVEEANLNFETIGVGITLTGSALACGPIEADTFSLEGIQHLENLTVLQLAFDGAVESVDTAPLAQLGSLAVLFLTTEGEVPLDVTGIDSLASLEGFGFARLSQDALDDLARLQALTFVARAAVGSEDYGFLLEIPALEVVGLGADSGSLPEDIATELTQRGVAIITLEG